MEDLGSSMTGIRDHESDLHQTLADCLVVQRLVQRRVEPGLYFRRQIPWREDRVPGRYDELRQPAFGGCRDVWKDVCATWACDRNRLQRAALQLGNCPTQ